MRALLRKCCDLALMRERLRGYHNVELPAVDLALEPTAALHVAGLVVLAGRGALVLARRGAGRFAFQMTTRFGSARSLLASSRIRLQAC